jgi:hypothetical protein
MGDTTNLSSRTIKSPVLGPYPKGSAWLFLGTKLLDISYYAHIRCKQILNNKAQRD